MESFTFQPKTFEPKKEDILPVQKFASEEKPYKEKLDREREQERLNQLVDLFFDDRGGMKGIPGGSEFQNRLTNFIILEGKDFDPTGPFMTRLVRRISSDARCDVNVDVPKVIRGVSSVVDFLLEKNKEPEDFEKQRILGFNKELDDQYAIDVLDFNYEIIGDEIIIDKLHLVQVKSHESIARQDASKIKKEHREFVAQFEMMAKFKALMDLKPLPKTSASAEKIKSAIPDEILNVMVALDSNGKEKYDLERVKKDLKVFLKKKEGEDIDIEQLDFLGKEIADEINNGNIDGEEEVRAGEEIIRIVDAAVSKYKGKIVTYKKKVTFSENAEIKSIIAVGSKIIEDLTTNIDAPH